MAFYYYKLILLFILVEIRVTFCGKIERRGIQEETTATLIMTQGTEVPLQSTTVSDLAPEWGGNCTQKHWKKCSNLKTWVTSYMVNVKKPELGYKYYETDCLSERPICLKNGYTVTRCQLLCMRCNKEFLSKYDKYVDREGPCLQ